jgi:hypothetical protein
MFPGGSIMEQDPRRHGCYIDPAPVLDIMIEQLQFLAAHATENCGPECVDCARIAQVRNWLLLPFLPAKYPPNSRSIAA